MGVTASYDIARDPSTIFDIVRGDLVGVGSALDTIASHICMKIDNTEDDVTPLLESNLSLDLAKALYSGGDRR